MAAGGNGESAEKRQGGKIDIIPGCQVWCKTEFEEIQGTVAAYDPNFGVLVISILSNGTFSRRIAQASFSCSFSNSDHSL